MGKAGIGEEVYWDELRAKMHLEALQDCFHQKIKLTSRMSGGKPLFAALEIVNKTTWANSGYFIENRGQWGAARPSPCFLCLWKDI